jgi:lipopolysaccharide transport system ATP-binding protein
MIGAAKEVCEGYSTFTRELASGLPATPTSAPKKTEVDRSTVDLAIATAPMLPQDRKVGLGSLNQALCISTLEPRDGGFGVKEANIVSVKFQNDDGSELGIVAGGEAVRVRIEVVSKTALLRPMIGFFVKDSLGQPLFGDNTYQTYMDRPLEVTSNGTLTAEFHFDLPLMRTGGYTMTVAVVEGTPLDHVVQHWIHDALLFQVSAPLSNGVMIGIPMRSINVTVD